MNIYKYLCVILIFITSKIIFATTFTGTKAKDYDITTPIENNTKISEFNNAIREVKIIETNEEKITNITGTYTVAGTETIILGSSTSGYTISFPTASTIATNTITKKYVIKNINTGTITINLNVDGIGSPTVTGSQTMKLFTNGTSWYEERVRISAISSDTELLDSLDSTYFTNATNLATGTVNLNRLPGTLTGKSADYLDDQDSTYYTNASNLASGTIPLARIPSTLTGKDADTIDTINGTDIVQTSRTISTTSPLSGGGALSANLTLTIPLATSGQNGYISSSDWNTFNNKVSTNWTINTTSPITGGGDASVNRTIAMATATASVDGFLKALDFATFNNKQNALNGAYLNQWQVSSTTGTGNIAFAAGSGIGLTPTFSNGYGTITITAAGTSSAGGWTDTGTQTIATAGLKIVAQGTIAVHADYGISGLLDRDIPNTITLDNLTQITMRNYDDITGTATIKPTQIAVGTSTLSGAANIAGTVTATGFSGNGAGLTNIVTTWADITGALTGNGSITASTGTSSSGKIAILDNNGKYDSFVNGAGIFTRSGTNIFPGIITDTLSIGTTTASIGSGSVNILGSLTTYEAVIFQGNTGSSTIIKTSPAYRYYAFKFATNYGYGGNMGVRRIELQSNGTSVYPPAYSTTYVKATTELYPAHHATNPANSLTGDSANITWVASADTNQRFHIDLGTGTKNINRIYYENYHSSGGITNAGVKDFTFWGSNNVSDFNDVTYANNGTWQPIAVNISSFTQHVASNTTDPKYGTATIQTALSINSDLLKLGTITVAKSFTGTSTVVSGTFTGFVEMIDNGVGVVVQSEATSANITASDTFVSFRDNTGAEIGGIAGTGVSGVIAYTTFTGGHGCLIEGDRTGLRPLDILEISDGGNLREWKYSKKEIKEVEEDVLDDKGNPIIEKYGTGTVILTRHKTIKTLKEILVPTIMKVASKPQLVKLQICKTRKSPNAVGLYAGTDSSGRDMYFGLGTAVCRVVNLGENIKKNDYLMSSDFANMLERQPNITIDGKEYRIQCDYSIVKASEEIIWEDGEQSREIACRVIGG